MSLSRRNVRVRISDAIAEALGAQGWRQSAYAYDALGYDGQSAAHLSYAVGIGRTAPAQLDRQRPSVGSVAQTTVLVRYLHRLRGGDQVGDYDDALEAGRSLLAAVLSVDKDAELSVIWVEEAPLQIVADGSFVRGQHSFSVLHRAALQA